MDLMLVDLQRLGRIVIQIKAYRQQTLGKYTDTGLNTHLKEHLSIGDFLFWYTLHQRAAIKE